MQIAAAQLSVFLTLLPLLAAGAHVELSSKYLFSNVLFNSRGEFYGLYWNYSIADGTIHFAVNVSTTGWVGFGVSPNGQMPGSDVVMGWVAANGTTYFHDRYAETRERPSIDKSQDWFLSSGVEEDGFTVLEFIRNLTTCDKDDLEIGVGTARVIWSFNVNDPSDSLGESAMFHNYQGSRSINLLGGLTSPPSQPADLQSFDLTVSNVTIPRDSTTYWCQSFELPEDVRLATKYVTKVSPVITPNTHAFVHHMLIYQCSSPLNDSLVDESGPCHAVSGDVRACRGGILIGGWAVGGEDFVYPENVALPIGGAGESQHAVIEMHYDNPDMLEGILDSSGMRFFYSSAPREHDAGVMFLGHDVTPFMVIPPGTTNYTIGAVCSASCTKSYLPDGGIKIFANILHTHLVGRGLELRHLRWNADCQVYEELQPIDLNLNYDFNFQQYAYLPKEVTVLPGDILILKCHYNTTKKVNVTTGGESTFEEMCLAFPVFYPRPPGRRNLDACVSSPLVNAPTVNSFDAFNQKYLPLNPEAAALYQQGRLLESYNAIEWTSNAVQDLERSILRGPTGAYCRSSVAGDQGMGELMNLGLPQSSCPYEAPDQCTGFKPQSCCERLAAAAAVPLVTHLNSVIVMCSTLLSAMLLISAAY